MQQPDQNKKVCTHHCCECDGCGAVCAHGIGIRKGYWVRHFLILVFGVIAAFFVGYSLGELKGYIMASYGVPMHTRMMR